MEDTMRENAGLAAIEEPTNEEVSLIETKPEFKAFVLWRTLPSIVRNPPKEKSGHQPTAREFAMSMGIEDEAALEMISIRTQEDFAEKYGVHHSTLTRWNKIIRKRDPLADMRAWSYELNRNVAFSLYNKAIRGGLPEHYALWFKLMAGWSEKVRVDARVLKKVEFEVVHRNLPVPETA